MTYATKFLLRGESPRDYSDILRSFKHVPTVNVVDFAHMVARITNRLVPGFFSPYEGRLTETEPRYIEAAQQKRLKVSLPYLSDDRPVTNFAAGVHPITGVADRFLLFDAFHENNTKEPKEALRRSTLVEEINRDINTSAAEQLNRDKARDAYYFNQMKPTNHVFTFRLLTHLKNQITNLNFKRDIERHHHVKLTLNHLGQLVKENYTNPRCRSINTKVVSIKDHSGSTVTSHIVSIAIS